MRTKKFEVGQLVMLEWVDSCRHNSMEWTEEGDLEEGVSRCQSVGWVLNVGDDSVMVAHNRDQENQVVCGVMSIPMVAITDSRVLGCS